MSIADHQARAATLLSDAGVLPVVTVASVDQALRLAEALFEGGLTAIELTLRTPVAIEALAALKRAHPTAVIGAGTVLDDAQIAASVDAGADFLVTPGTTPRHADALARVELPVVPGGATPTEFLALRERGFRACKLFPANAVGGLAMLKGLAGPVADLRFCPTGGIGPDNATEFLSQPNVLCVGGSWMVSPAWLAAGDWDRVREASAGAAALVRAARGG